jgi:hypothetical protein
VRFYRVTELITQLLEAREERQLGRMKSQLAKLDLLILDELGYVPASKAGAELLLRRDQPGVRAVERGGDVEPAVRAVDGGAAERAADGCDAGSADAPVHDPGDGRGELSVARRPSPSPREVVDTAPGGR